MVFGSRVPGAVSGGGTGEIQRVSAGDHQGGPGADCPASGLYGTEYLQRLYRARGSGWRTGVCESAGRVPEDGGRMAGDAGMSVLGREILI